MHRAALLSAWARGRLHMWRLRYATWPCVVTILMFNPHGPTLGTSKDRTQAFHCMLPESRQRARRSHLDDGSPRPYRRTQSRRDHLTRARDHVGHVPPLDYRTGIKGIAENAIMEVSDDHCKWRTNQVLATVALGKSLTTTSFD